MLKLKLLLSKNQKIIGHSLRYMHDRKLPFVENYNWHNDNNKKKIGITSPKKNTTSSTLNQNTTNSILTQKKINK